MFDIDVVHSSLKTPSPIQVPPGSKDAFLLDKLGNLVKGYRSKLGLPNDWEPRTIDECLAEKERLLPNINDMLNAQV